MADRVFSAVQIKVPQELPTILKDFAKEAIRADPSKEKSGLEARKEIAAWAVKYFQDLSQ